MGKRDWQLIGILGLYPAVILLIAAFAIVTTATNKSVKVLTSTHDGTPITFAVVEKTHELRFPNSLMSFTTVYRDLADGSLKTRWFYPMQRFGGGSMLHGQPTQQQREIWNKFFGDNRSS